MNRGVRVTPETVDRIMWLLTYDSGAVLNLYRLMSGGKAPEECSDLVLRRRYEKGRKSRKK